MPAPCFCRRLQKNQCHVYKVQQIVPYATVAMYQKALLSRWDALLLVLREPERASFLLEYSWQKPVDTVPWAIAPSLFPTPKEILYLGLSEKTEFKRR